ncbi:MAG: hypothetical protein LC667_19530 [Thioalkalivibrio sp.]|nr:hypothetical protein [Thioalkalivibrio sp.]
MSGYRYLLIPFAALLHLAVSGGLLLAGAGASLERLESGTQAGSAWLERVAGTAGHILLYPIFIPGNALLGRTPGPVSWLLLIANSLVWAMAVYLLARLVANRRGRNRARSSHQ